jgi:hypothetical protein
MNQKEKIRIFVSSVQKELELERVAVASWVSADPQLADVCEVVLFEKEPLSGKRIRKPYLECLETCQIYLLILDCEYGNPPEFSATHEEYRFACEKGLPILIFLKGKTDYRREAKTKAFLKEIKDDDNTYKRFHDRLDLEPEFRKALNRALENLFDVQIESEPADTVPSVESASVFEQQALDISADQLDETSSEKWLRAIKAVPEGQSLSDIERLNALRQKDWFGLKVAYSGHRRPVCFFWAKTRRPDSRNAGFLPMHSGERFRTAPRRIRSHFPGQLRFWSNRSGNLFRKTRVIRCGLSA